MRILVCLLLSISAIAQDSTIYRATSFEIKDPKHELKVTSEAVCNWSVMLSDDKVRIDHERFSGEEWDEVVMKFRDSTSVKYLSLQCHDQNGDACELMLFGDENGVPTLLIVAYPKIEFWYDIEKV